MIEFSQVYGNRKRRKYGLFSNLMYNIRAVWQFDRKLFWCQFLPIVPTVLAAYLGTLLPAEVVRVLQEEWSVDRIIGYICLLTVVLIICNMISKGMNNYTGTVSHRLSLFYADKCFRKVMDLDYDLLEQPEKQDVIGNAWKGVRDSYNFDLACMAFPICLSSGVSVVFYGILIGRKSILLVALMILSVALSMYLLNFARKKHRECYDRLSRYSKEAAYISSQAIDGSAGKDIRIYKLLDLFLKKYDEALEHMGKVFAGIHNWYFLKHVSDAVFGFVIDFFAWGYLIYLLVQERLTAAEFVLYLGLMNGFAAYFETFIRFVLQMGPMSVSISYIRELLEMENRWGSSDKAQGIAEIVSPITIELRDVSYTYPGNDTPTLSHISLTIKVGEKLALLGLNGAGKTTLVKLICGFYQPTEGSILANGRLITDYNREAYYKAVSVLFQDSGLLPVGMDENLTCAGAEERDGKKLNWALSMSGFEEKYRSLQGSTFDSTAFSGGELQKCLFARALYKESGLLILDEPTAALDPIAENELYQHFSEAAAGRTTIYISHRLSSTRFCDRIVLLEHGTIVEEGTHESLMREKTRYAELFEIQSRYYKMQEENMRRSALMGDTYVENAAEQEGVFA